MATRKDYRKVAGILHRITKEVEVDVAATYTATSITVALADYFAEDNELFDRQRFLEAVETGKRID